MLIKKGTVLGTFINNGIISRFSVMRRYAQAFIQPASTTIPSQSEIKTGSTAKIPLRAPPLPQRSGMRRKMNVVKEQQATKRISTAVAVCTAKSYDFVRLCSYLSSTFSYAKIIDEDVLHVKLTDDGDSSSLVEAFFFTDGCFALWGAPTDVSALRLRLQESIRPFEIGTLKEAETETLFYQSEKSQTFFAGMEGETIILEIPLEANNQEIVATKLAFSNGLVDSVKLGYLERLLHEFIERIKFIPDTLANGGKFPIGRAAVLRLTGELLRFRADLNLHGELTDTPELYWSEPRLEELYIRTAKVLDLRQRANILNRRLDYANELVGVLRQHLSEVHGLKLEWGIIALIAVEVGFEVIHWTTQLGGGGAGA